MGLQGEQWEQVLSAYRDVNDLFGDIVKVTPSSKCVGDLVRKVLLILIIESSYVCIVWCVKALYLVTRGLSTKDLLSSGAKGQVVDFPGNNVDCVHKFHHLLYVNLFDSYFFFQKVLLGSCAGS